MLRTATKFLRDMWPQLLAMSLCLGLMMVASYLLDRSTRSCTASSNAIPEASCHSCDHQNPIVESMKE